MDTRILPCFVLAIKYHLIRSQLLLCSLLWLRVPEWISFRLVVLVYRCLHGSAPGYLAPELQCILDLKTHW